MPRYRELVIQGLVANSVKQSELYYTYAMSANSPELNKDQPKQKGGEKTIYDELAEIAKQKKLEADQAEQDLAEESRKEAEATVEDSTQADPIEAEVDAETQTENEKYLADLMHHMKSQQPEIYKEALSKLAADANQEGEEPKSAEDLDAELEERLAKQGSIPADLLKEMTADMRGEEIRAHSNVWKEVNASGMVGDIARRWRDMYERAMREIMQ